MMYRSRGHVLRQLGQRVERRSGDVDCLFESRVEHLCDEHEGDRQQERDQLEPRHADRNGGDKHRDCDREVDAQVPLRAEDMNDAFQRVVEAVEQRRHTARFHTCAPCARSRVSISRPWS